MKEIWNITSIEFEYYILGISVSQKERTEELENLE